MLVHFRKRLSLEFVNQVNAVVVQQMLGVESAEAKEAEVIILNPFMPTRFTARSTTAGGIRTYPETLWNPWHSVGELRYSDRL